MRLTYSEWVINWCWYVEVTINDDNTVTIHKHYRLHGERDKHPESVGTYRIIEDDSRIATGIELDGKVHSVANPSHVFSYNEQ